MFYIAICDDSKEEAAALHEAVAAFLEKNGELAEVSVYTKSNLLLYDLEEGKYFDLILSDIEMPEVDGLRLAKIAKNQLPEVYLIFITSYLKYAVDSFELSIFRYIPKAELSKKLDTALGDVFCMLHLQTDCFYMIETPTRMEKIAYCKIASIEKEKKYSVLHLLDGTSTRVRKGVAQVYEELHADDFVFIDRATIVNMAHIVSMKENVILMEDGSRLYPSYARLDEIKQKLSKYWRKIICN